MSKVKLSIVVPIYNVEKFLKKALDSLKYQDLKNIEILMVDDCSTDSSFSIAESYSEEDNRFRLIKLDKNSGYGKACNIGIKSAKGTYITILEPDDFIDKKAYLQLCNKLDKTKSDAIRFGFFKFYNIKDKSKFSYDNHIKCLRIPVDKAFDPITTPGAFVYQPTVWGFVYRKEFLKNNKIEFNETPGASYQDNAYYFKVLASIKNLIVSSESYYYYRQHAGQSINNTRKVSAPIIEMKSIKEFIEKKYKKWECERYQILHQQLVNRTLDYMPIHIERLANDLKKEYFNEYKVFFDKSLFDSDEQKWDCYAKLIPRRKKIFRKIDNSIDYEKFIISSGYYYLNEQLKRTELPLKLGELVKIKRISPAFENYFFGYYDIKSMNSTKNIHLALKVSNIHRQPDKHDYAEVCLIHDAKEIEILDRTLAWNFQQGCLLQFLPNNDDEIIYNYYDNVRKSYGAKKFNLNTKEIKRINDPICSISSEGNKALSLNFSRIYDYRPGYGYCQLEDPFEDEKSSDLDGLFEIDLETNQKKLIISTSSLMELCGDEELNDYKILINHATYSPDGKKAIILVRYFSKIPPWPTFTMIVDIETGKAEKIFGFGSHYYWKNNSELLLSGTDIINRDELIRKSLYEINLVNGLNKEIDGSFFKDDGHCIYSPNREYILYDSYSSKKIPYRELYLYSMKLKKGICLVSLLSDWRIHNNDVDCRCDLHARWSEDGKLITFDSVHEGFRGIYCIDAEEAQNKIDNYTCETNLEIIENLLKKNNDQKNHKITKRQQEWIKFSEMSRKNKIKYLIKKEFPMGSKYKCQPKVSICIPLYKTEGYLERCLNTVINQTLKDIEIIIVDDCSPDKSIDIINKYIAIDNRIKLIKHRENIGLGGARNTGINSASAPYVGLIDSDDEISLDMYEILYNKAIEHEADVVVCGVNKFIERNNTEHSFVQYDKEIVLDEDVFKTYMENEKIIPAAYNKLYKRSIFIENNVKFPNHIYHQDICTQPQFMYYVNKAVLIPDVLYFYRQREGSAVFSFSELHIDSIEGIVSIVKEFLDKVGIFEEYKDLYYKNIVFERAIYFHIKRIQNNCKDTDSVNKYIVESMKRIFGIIDVQDFLSIFNNEEINEKIKDLNLTSTFLIQDLKVEKLKTDKGSLIIKSREIVFCDE